MDDLTTYAFLTASFFFVALAVGLLVRYRQASQNLNTSTDIGRDLWLSLEQRLKKQDERILDMMGRLEVIQSRVLSAPASQVPVPPVPVAVPVVASDLPPSVPVSSPGPVDEHPITQQVQSQPSQESQASQVQVSLGHTSELKLDETQLAAIRLLADSPKNTRQLTDFLKKSREHTARIMKSLFEAGLVSRDASTKPFVYQLTETGRRELPPPAP